jgi:serine protease Do
MGASKLRQFKAMSRLLFCVFAISGFATHVAAKGAPESFADLSAQLSPAVVNISTSQTVSRAPEGGAPMPEFPPGSPFEDLFRDFFDKGQGAPRKVTSLGSGFVVDPNGTVITNNHVIEDADKVTVNFSDGSTLPAEIIGRDPKTDIAVLKVESDKPLPSVPFGNADAARVGDWVLAIGNPFGLGGSVSAGIISARNRDINAGPYDDFIQTDAAINRGNSGGPLFNMEGQVIGVNTAIISPSGGSIGIGFAIPSSLVRPVVAQLQKYGETRRGWLGVRIQTVTEEIAESLSLPTAKGALVAGVTDESPADKAGFEQGDIITKFDGKGVTEMRSLPRIVAETEIGKKVNVELIRNGKVLKKRVEVGRLEETDEVASLSEDEDESSGGVIEHESMGLTLSKLTPTLRDRFNITQETEGVLITSVDPESPAAEKQVRAGDVLVQVGPDMEEVFDPQDVIDVVNKITTSKNQSVLLGLSRAGDFRWVAVRIDRS